MTTRVALTGAAGFLGRHVVADLTARGHDLSVLVHRTLPADLPPDARIVQGGLHDAAALSDLVRGADAIVHLAGVIKARTAGDFLHANAEGTAALARAWRDHAPHACFLKVSSMAAREPGLSPYAASKRAAEQRLAEVHPEGDWRVLRPCAVYGPGDRETLGLFKAAAAPVQPLLNGRESRLCLIHATDVASAVSALLANSYRHTVLEVTDARVDGYGWGEMMAAASHAVGRPVRQMRVPAPLVRMAGLGGDLLAWASGRAVMTTSCKTREILHLDWSSSVHAQPGRAHWFPEIDLAAGFANTVAWYRAQGWLPR